MKIKSILCALALCASSALALDAYYVVTVTDMLGDKTFSVLDKEELAALKKEVALEAKYFPKALAKIQKEWTAPENKDAHQFKWQGGKLKPRSVKESPAYTDKQKADDKVSKLLDKELGLDDSSKPKRKKKLTEAEYEKQQREESRHLELKNLADDVAREIKALIDADAKK